MNDIFADLAWRGLIQQTTDERYLPEWLTTGSRTLYVGFDPTADSLHVGSLLPLLILRRFQRAGHRPIAVVGGATGMIGDPSGKSEERNLLSVETLRANVEGLQRQMRQFLDFDCGANVGLAGEQFRLDAPVQLPGFPARHRQEFSGQRDAEPRTRSRRRLERSDGGLSYTEFSYMLLQAYDFVHLYDQYGCELQVGGSDQWGNITAGIDLARRMRGVQLYGMTCPLLTKATAPRWARPKRAPSGWPPIETSPYASSTNTGSTSTTPMSERACGCSPS